MKNLANIAILAIAVLTFEACYSTRATSGSTANTNSSADDTKAPGYATSTASGNIVVGGSAASASISGTSGNAMVNKPAGTMGTANTTSGVEETAPAARSDSANADSADLSGSENATKSGIAGEAIQFVKAAAISGMTEVRLSQLALKSAQGKAVKEYARMMVKDHGGANAELKALASAKGITFPESSAANLSASAKAGMEKLSNSAGKDFDQNYTQLMINDHEKAVALFEQGATSADPQVKAYANKHLPTLKMHLQAINAIAKSINNGSNK